MPPLGCNPFEMAKGVLELLYDTKVLVIFDPWNRDVIHKLLNL
jgi:hypothetical protein